MENFPLLDSRVKENFLSEMTHLLEKVDDGQLKAQRGGLLYTLLSLYSVMLAGTVSRLNLAPEKHRLAFLNLQQIPRRAARPCKTFAVFEVAEGYDYPVTIPKGSLIAAETDGVPTLYRTKLAFDAVPSKILDVFWSDSETDVVKPVYAHDEKPWSSVYLWEDIPQEQGRHVVDFLFENVFIDMDGCHSVLLNINSMIDGKPFDSGIFTDTSKFLWSIHSFAEDVALCAPIAVQKVGNDLVRLSYKDFPYQHSIARLHLELLDAKLTDISIQSLHIHSSDSDIPPEAATVGDHELNISDFFPFQNPMQAFGECFIFCGNALLHQGAEIMAEFDLTLEETFIELPKEEETINYKWIMKRPQSKAPPEIAEAFAQSVLWEYWNGSAYCALLKDGDPGADFTVSGSHALMKFDCPMDIAEGNAGGRTGYFLRLSSGICDALYKLPRRIYTPRIGSLKFSYRCKSPVFPIKITAENFGEVQVLAVDEPIVPFCKPPKGQQFFIGLDTMYSGVRMQFFFELQEYMEKKPMFLAAQMYGTSENLVIDDGTLGMMKSGLVSIILPKNPVEVSLFGKKRYWISMSLVERQAPCLIKKILINGQRVENRIRHKQYFSFSSLGTYGEVRLSHGNIARAWVFVRVCSVDEADKWERWTAYPLSDGNFSEGYYTLDYSSGILALPMEILARAVETPNEDFIGVTYDTCDGASGNVSVGEINRMYEEIPFISAVYNPLAAMSGEDSESDGNLAARSEHRLHHSGRAVSERDFELIASDLYPQIYQAKCLAGRPVKLALLLKDDEKHMIFPQIRARLMQEFKENGCAEAVGTTVKIIKAISVPILIKMRFISEKLFIGARLERLETQITEFLSPITGGLHGDGWRMGEMPTYEQIKAFISLKAVGLVLEEITITAGGEFCKPWQETKFGHFHVPGEVQSELEVEQ